MQVDYISVLDTLPVHTGTVTFADSQDEGGYSQIPKCESRQSNIPWTPANRKPGFGHTFTWAPGDVPTGNKRRKPSSRTCRAKSVVGKHLQLPTNKKGKLCTVQQCKYRNTTHGPQDTTGQSNTIAYIWAGPLSYMLQARAGRVTWRTSRSIMPHPAFRSTPHSGIPTKVKQS